ncbi:PE domain-containing protein [Saccharothrix hoggarensis]|uniref:PE domain-containing protein n=1 Tax=Saccharothrix hoggarensis TaxID=913853 RepID=A0ABW3QET5_9PSEU
MEPEKVLDLIRRYEDVRNDVLDFLDAHRDSLFGRPLADDEISADAAKVFTDHSTLALDVTNKFLAELNANIEQLLAAARTYGLVEDGNTEAIHKIHEVADR